MKAFPQSYPQAAYLDMALDSEASVVRVALPVPLRQLYDYYPPAGVGPLAPGVRVAVPFGRRTLVGMVLADGAARQTTLELKTIQQVIDAEPLVTAEWLDSLRWAAAYYQHPLGEAISTALPGRLREAATVDLRRQTRLSLTAVGREVLREDRVKAQKLRAGLRWLADGPQLQRAGRRAGPFDAAGLRRALAQGWVEASEELPVPPPAPDLPPLTAEQQAALTALEDGTGFKVSLLEGVTGSGKTELYLRLAAQALASGRQVLVLCPEIGLTPQLSGRFRARFGEAVVSFHSGMGESARAQAWLAVRERQAQVLVGTRSAVFAPFADLGLVVVDEEHDVSYKQQEGFRYHARDLALMRAKRHGATVVLGSATPALESLANAALGRYQHVRLQARVSGRAPPVPACIDLKVHPARDGLAEPLATAIERHLEAGGQTLLFINRRGYAPALLCDRCHWVAPCPRCDARLNLHRGEQALRCHHCGWVQRPPRECPSCGGRSLLPVGEGAERVEEGLKNRFPGRRIERFDTDRLASAGRLEALLAEVHAGRVDILVGTQMLAKGHDFPRVSLVGVVNADQALFSTDFRALERFGQLLTQVAGRAGRQPQGLLPPEVWIQTREPRHPALRTLIDGGYAALAKSLLVERREAGLPPYGYLALLRAEASEPATAIGFLQAAAECFPASPAVTLMGPAPAPMVRRESRHRAQLLLLATQRSALQGALAAWLPAIEALPGSRRLRWSMDVDPADLF